MSSEAFTLQIVELPRLEWKLRRCVCVVKSLTQIMRYERGNIFWDTCTKGVINRLWDTKWVIDYEIRKG